MKNPIKKVLIYFLAFTLIFSGLTAQTAFAKSSLKDKGIPLIVLSCYSRTIDVEEEFYLIAVPGKLVMPEFKSSNNSVASVNTYGKVTGKKAGNATITAKIKGAEASCKVKVRKPTLTLDKTKITLFKGQSALLSATPSTSEEVSFKSNKSSVATVDEDGMITAEKNGTATITAKINGVSKKCTVTVKKPTLKLSKDLVSLKVGESVRLTCKTNSPNAPEWSVSNINRLSCENGLITARSAGKAYVYASDDGAKVSCIVTIEE